MAHFLGRKYWSQVERVSLVPTCAQTDRYRGHEVLCVDNFYTGRRTNLTRCCSIPLEVLRHDICFPLYVSGWDLQPGVPTSPVHYQFDGQTTKTSVNGSINMLKGSPNA